MNYDETDDIISKKYMSAEPHFDAEGVWDDLEQKLKKKRRRGAWLWYFAGISLVVLLASIWLSTEDYLVEDQATLDQVEEGQIKNDQEVAQLSDNSDNTQNGIIDSDEKSMHDIKKETTKNVFEVKEVDKSSGAGRLEAQILQNPKIKRTASKMTGNDVGANSNKMNFASHLILNPSNKDILYQQQEEVRESQKSIFTEMLPSFTMSLDYAREPLIMDDISPPLIMYPSHKESKLTLGFFGGYFIHSRSLDHTGNSNLESYTSRVAEEEALDAFDLGIKMNYDFSNRWGVFGGLRYSSSFVGRNAEYVYLESITIPDYTVRIVQTEEGIVEEKETITYDGYYQHKSNNYLNSRRVGFLGGLQYRIGQGRLSSSLNIGLEVPLWTSYTGTITHEGRPYNFADEELDIHNPQVLIYTGLGVRYSLADGVGLQGTINGYLPLGNEYKETYNISKKSTLLGVNLEIQFEL